MTNHIKKFLLIQLVFAGEFLLNRLAILPVHQNFSLRTGQLLNHQIELSSLPLHVLLPD